MAKHATPYLHPGRLSDVLALIQVLAFDPDTYRSEEGLLDELQRGPAHGHSWMEVAREHPEFFRVRNNPDKQPRAALLARYVLPKTHQVNEEEKRPPLEPDLAKKLLELAVDLHDKQVERASRWRTTLLPIGVAGIAAGASIAAAIIGLAKSSSPPPAITVTVPAAPMTPASTPASATTQAPRR
jgi:hypothetical protein